MTNKFRNIAKDRNLHCGQKFNPYDKSLKQRARSLRKSATLEERRLWHFLRKLQMKVYRQRPIDHYIVDFYIASHKLVIEVDGSQHYTNEETAYDEKRSAILSLYGIKVMRISNVAVRERFEDVCANIRFTLGLNST